MKFLKAIFGINTTIPDANHLSSGFNSSPSKEKLTPPNRLHAHRLGFHRLGQTSLSSRLFSAAFFLLLGIGIWQQNQLQQLAANILAERYGFIVKDVTVKGRQHIDVDSLKAAMNITSGMPIFGISVKEMAEKIAAIPWVKAVAVERSLPDKIHVVLQERVPLALWQNKGVFYVVDADGKNLGEVSAETYHGLPILIGDDAPAHAPAFLEMAATVPVLLKELDNAVFINGRRWNIRLKNGVTIKLPEENFHEALQRIGDDERIKQAMERSVIAIDLRDHEKITVQTAGALIDDKIEDTVPVKAHKKVKQ
ncbi:MAG: cell division protein FtsQ/DivIB [Alphaproteobacteria bacterium]